MLEFYFTNVKLFWPYELYRYSEDLALTYLMHKNYDIELALALIRKYTKKGLCIHPINVFNMVCFRFSHGFG